MASSRTRRRPSRGRRADARRSSSSPPVYLIVSLVLGAAALLIVFAMRGGGGSDNASAASTETAAAGGRSPSSEKRTGAARAGSRPGRAAPAIPDAVWSEADELYDEAVALWNKGQKARRSGTTSDYQQALLDAWDVLDKLYDKLSPYTDWFEEADLEGWAMPADYDQLQQRLNKWDSLRSKVKRLKPIGRD